SHGQQTGDRGRLSGAAARPITIHSGRSLAGSRPAGRRREGTRRRRRGGRDRAGGRRVAAVAAPAIVAGPYSLWRHPAGCRDRCPGGVGAARGQAGSRPPWLNGPSGPNVTTGREPFGPDRPGAGKGILERAGWERTDRARTEEVRPDAVWGSGD